MEVYLLQRFIFYIKVAICLGNKQEGEKKKALGGSADGFVCLAIR